MRNVVLDPSPHADRLVLLRVSKESMMFHRIDLGYGLTDGFGKLAELSPDARDFLAAQQTVFVPYDVELTYDYWTAGTCNFNYQSVFDLLSYL